MQASGDMHDTAESDAPRSPARPRSGWIDQLLPSQRSTSALFEEPPTAVQAVGELQDTPLSPLPPDAVAFGVGSIDQVVPFQRSTSTYAVPPGRPPVSV